MVSRSRREGLELLLSLAVPLKFPLPGLVVKLLLLLMVPEQLLVVVRPPLVSQSALLVSLVPLAKGVLIEEVRVHVLPEVLPEAEVSLSSVLFPVTAKSPLSLAFPLLLQ